MTPMAPCVTLLEEMWSRVLISALTVQVRVENNVLITVPVAAELLLPAWDWEISKPHIGHKKDPQWLAGLLSRTAFTTPFTEDVCCPWE